MDEKGNTNSWARLYSFIKIYPEKTGEIHNFREALLRYSAYLYYGVIPKNMFDKAINMISPFIKMPIELSMGVNFSPSAVNPRAIRDKTEHFLLHEKSNPAKTEIGKKQGEKSLSYGVARPLAIEYGIGLDEVPERVVEFCNCQAKNSPPF